MSGYYTDLERRVLTLPEPKASEYLAELDHMLRSHDVEAWADFEFRLQRAEYLSSRMHFSEVRDAVA